MFDIPDNDCKNHKYDSLILDKLRTSDYGRCVYRCDNDQCDHFVASLEFDNNITGAFSMEALPVAVLPVLWERKAGSREI